MKQLTGIHAHNGEICVGDLVRYDDGWLCFTARIVEHGGAFGFFVEDAFHALDVFIRDFSVVQGAAALDFVIIEEAL